MLKIGTEFLDLDKIADSGQCFRWRKIGEREYIIPAYGKELHVKQESGKGGWIELDCTQKEYSEIWEDYFDLKTRYEGYTEVLRTTVTPRYLYEAEKAARGIRILKQELWEVIVSFIISQNNNIPKIKGSIEKMCERYGGFPTAGQILDGGEDKLDGLGLGYRQKYVSAAAILYHNGGGSTERELKELDYKGAMEHLTRWLGIGPKVANCICLYGLGHKEAFPRDTWIKRIEAEYFDGHFPEEDYPEFAGVLQQYIFYYERSRKHGRD
jgi:N-glycosylase/DNA lyase